MRIEFTSSGGLANLPLTYHVETDTLPKEQAEELLTLVRNSGVLDNTENEKRPQTAGSPPDVVSYQLSVSDGDGQRTLTFNDVNAPASLRPLLARLRRLAMEQKRNAM